MEIDVDTPSPDIKAGGQRRSAPNVTAETSYLSELPPETLDRLKELARMIGRQLARESKP